VKRKKKEKKSKSAPEFKLGECRELLRHDFTPDEAVAMSVEMANNYKALAIKDKDRASVVSQFTSDIKALEAKLAAIAERLSAGYEMREVACEIRWDYAKDRKTVTRTDTREIIRDERIPESERQVELPLKEKTPDQLVADAKAAVADAQREIEKRSEKLKAPLAPEERASILATGSADL
jgi:predicted  nucleic acid-binding Zn-ribbon protein